MDNKEIPLSEFSQRHADGIAKALSYILSNQYHCEATVTARKKDTAFIKRKDPTQSVEG